MVIASFISEQTHVAHRRMQIVGRGGAMVPTGSPHRKQRRACRQSGCVLPAAVLTAWADKAQFLTDGIREPKEAHGGQKIEGTDQ